MGMQILMVEQAKSRTNTSKIVRLLQKHVDKYYPHLAGRGEDNSYIGSNPVGGNTTPPVLVDTVNDCTRPESRVASSKTRDGDR